MGKKHKKFDKVAESLKFAGCWKININEIEHAKTKATVPQSIIIYKVFYQTILKKLKLVAFTRKIYGDLESLQTRLDGYINHCKNELTHPGKLCLGRTPVHDNIYQFLNMKDGCYVVFEE